MAFVDRESKYPNRVLITPEDGSAPFYATLTRADEPTVLGTPLNATVLNALVNHDDLAAYITYGTELPETLEEGKFFGLISE